MATGFADSDAAAAPPPAPPGLEEALEAVGFQEEAVDAPNFFQLAGIDPEEFHTVIPGGENVDGRRRIWKFGHGPGSDWTKDPNPYHSAKTRPKTSDMHWYFFVPGAKWNQNNKHRGATEVWDSWDEAAASKKFNPDWPTKFVIGGFMTDEKDPSFGELIDGILAKYPDGINLILVETSNGMFKNFANTSWLNLIGLGDVETVMYLEAAHNTQDVGFQTASVYSKLLWVHRVAAGQKHKMLHSNGVSWNVQCIGGSLGGQACGRFGRTVDAISGTPVNRITALDAAGPAFQQGQALNDYSITNEDGYFVEAVHTNGKWAERSSFMQAVLEGYYGLAKPYGDADFYINGGQLQPGCDDYIGCAHGRMLELWRVTFQAGNEYKTQKCADFDACHCEGWDCEKKADKRTESDVTMGQFGTLGAEGLFFVPTSGNAERGFKFADELFVKEDGTRDEGMPVDGEETPVDLQSIVSSWSQFYKPADFNAPNNGVLTGMISRTSNAWFNYDRQFRFYHAQADEMTCSSRKTFKPSMSGLDFQCPDQQALYGLKSTYDKFWSDRVIEFKCCDIQSGGKFKIVSTRTTGFLNEYLKPQDFKCNANEVMIGVESEWSTWKKDRRWKVKCGSTVKITETPAQDPSVRRLEQAARRML